MDKLEQLIDKNFIKQINNENVDIVASEIRKFLVDNVLTTGGHLASNLGIVELTIAIHKVFNLPDDKVIFDVGHQCYVHKLLSGRLKDFPTLRQLGGISGFPKTEESPYDSFNTGHSSTSISAALGMARARDLKGENYNVVALIGDGAMGGGMAFEALNDAGVSKSKIIVILNDNEMSINENVGGLSSHLSMLRLNPNYISAKSRMRNFFNKLGFLGVFLTKLVKKVKRIIKFATIKIPVFEELGFKYIGLIDGYDIDELTDAFEKAKKSEKSVLIHVFTKKGRGHYEAEVNPCGYHGIPPRNGSDLTDNQTYTDVFGEYMVNKAAKNDRLVSITAAMCSSCGLSDFQSKYPDRLFDVGIAEQHAVTMAAGMAKNGLTPVFSVYSTFLQRAYDQILHDVCLQNLHVVFAIDRAGLVGEDGETHQGIFDFSYLLHLPNITVLAPSCKKEFTNMLDYAVDKLNGPVAIRFPKDYVDESTEVSLDFNEPRTIFYSGDEVVIISIGRMNTICEDTVKVLADEGYKNVHLVSICALKPLNINPLNELINKAKIAITVEDNIISGGAGEYIVSQLDRINKSKIINLGFNDTFVQQGKISELFKLHGLTAKNISDIIIKELITNE